MVFISIDTDNKQAKPFLEFVKTLPFIKIHEEPNVTSAQSLADAKEGKVTKHKNTKELISFLNK